MAMGLTSGKTAESTMDTGLPVAWMVTESILGKMEDATRVSIKKTGSMEQVSTHGRAENLTKAAGGMGSSMVKVFS